MSTQTIFKTVGQTSQSCDLALVQNAASTAAGDPVLGLAYNTTNLTAYYRIPGTGTLTAITLATQTVGGAWSSGGFVKIDDTHAPGQYRFDIPNACLASGGECNITFSGAPAGTAGNMATHTLKIIVTAFDLTVATQAVNVTQIGGGALPTGTVTNANFAPTSTQFECSNLTNPNASFYVGLSAYAQTGSLAGQLLGVVSAYTLSSGNGHFTVSGSPSGQSLSNGDTVVFV